MTGGHDGHDGRPVVSSPTMTLTVNGEPRRIRTGATALEVLAELGLAARPVAVEINEDVVPRARLCDRPLHEGDRLEIVTLVGGG